MGYSRWDRNEYATYASTTSATLRSARDSGLSDDMARRQVFTSSRLKPSFDPKGIAIRESRDSVENPNSTALIFGLDVTGSMGRIAEEMATVHLGRLIEKLLDTNVVADPHIMIMGIGDIFCDHAPVQASQFEADIRIAQQLSELYLEGGGGGNDFESYDMPWYFAANKTSIDCFEKRGKKGYLFTIGDEMPPMQSISANQINSVFGVSAQASISPAATLEAAKEKYDVFHVIVEQGSYASRAKNKVYDAWKSLLGTRAVRLNNYEYLSNVVVAAIALSEGKSLNEVLDSEQESGAKASIQYAFS